MKFPETKTKIYSILVVDLSECTYADIYSDAEIKIIFQNRLKYMNKFSLKSIQGQVEADGTML